MAKLSALIRKELQFYLNSAIAYGVIVLFLMFTAIWLFDINKFLAQNTAMLRQYFTIMPWVFVFLIPAITMRSWSEEMRMGTYEVLLTMPYPQYKLVLAKFLSPLILVGFMLALTLPMPLSLAPLGRFDAGIIIAEYFGIIMFAGAGIALGTYVSSLTKNQIVAFLLSMSILLALMLIDMISHGGILPDFIVNFLNFFSLNYHFESFVKGILDTRDLLFFLVFTAAFLFLTERRLVLRKWR